LTRILTAGEISIVKASEVALVVSPSNDFCSGGEHAF